MRGVILPSGEMWRDHRRFILHVFRDFGVGKTRMTDRIIEEVQYMNEHIVDIIDNSDKSDQQHIIDIAPALEICVANIMCRVLWNYRYETVCDTKHKQNKHQLQTDARFFKLKSSLEDFVEVIMHPITLAMRDKISLRHLPYFNRYFHMMVDTQETFLSYMREHITEHRRRFDPASDTQVLWGEY
jgi:hypothetical protein